MSIIGSFAPGAVELNRQITKDQHRNDVSPSPEATFYDGPERQDEIRRILSRIPTNVDDPSFLFRNHQGDIFDPNDPTADYKKWVKALGALSKKQEGSDARAAGVSWSRLNVYGYGSASGKALQLHLFAKSRLSENSRQHCTRNLAVSLGRSKGSTTPGVNP